MEGVPLNGVAVVVDIFLGVRGCGGRIIWVLYPQEEMEMQATPPLLLEPVPVVGYLAEHAVLSLDEPCREGKQTPQ